MVSGESPQFFWPPAGKTGNFVIGSWNDNRTGWIGVAVLMAGWVLLPALDADTLRLNSGESIFGRVVSETTNAVAIEIPNAARTIYQTRTILKTQIQSSLIDSADYAALDPYRPTPNMELAVADCDAGLQALTGFLKAHPDSGYAPEVQLQIKLLTEEKDHVTAGEVKFRNNWMTPAEKVERQRVSEAATTVQDLTAQRNQAENQRKYLTGVIANIQKEISPLAAQVAALPDRVTYRTMTGSGTRPNSVKQDQQQLLEKLTGRLQDKQAELAVLDRKLDEFKSQIQRAQDRYASLVAPKTSQTTVAKLAPNPAATVAPSSPWWQEYWYVSLGLVLLIGYLLLRS